MNSILIIASILAFSGYSVLALTECKTDIPLQQDFNLAEYISNKWFEIKSYSENLTCLITQYSGTTTDLVVRYSGFNLTSGQQFESKGKVFTNESNPANITVDFGEGTIESHLVIETNYTDYSLVYSCRVINGDLTESAWILSRKGSLPDDVVIELNATLHQATGSDTDQFNSIDQTKCSGSSQITLSLSLIALIYVIIKILV